MTSWLPVVVERQRRSTPGGRRRPTEVARREVVGPDLVPVATWSRSPARPPGAGSSSRRGSTAAARTGTPSSLVALTWSSPNSDEPGGHRVLGQVRMGPLVDVVRHAVAPVPAGTRSRCARGRPRRSASGTARRAGTCAGRACRATSTTIRHRSSRSSRPPRSSREGRGPIRPDRRVAEAGARASPRRRPRRTSGAARPGRPSAGDGGRRPGRAAGLARPPVGRGADDASRRRGVASATAERRRRPGRRPPSPVRRPVVARASSRSRRSSSVEALAARSARSCERAPRGRRRRCAAR